MSSALRSQPVCRLQSGVVPDAHASADAAGRARQLACAVAVCLVTFIVTFFCLGGSRTLTTHEAYLAVTAREMLATGDWIVPRFGGVPRLQKPPLGYWSAAISAWCVGEMDETVARLPTAISSFGLVLVVGIWAARWYGRNAGLCAAFVHVTSLHYILHCREATVDMLLCLLMTLAMYFAATQPVEESPRKSRLRWMGIYGLLGVSWLGKFHYGPALVLAPCIVYWLAEGRFRALWQLANPIGLALFAMIAFPWQWAVLREVPEAWSVWRHETVGRALGEMRPEPFYYFAVAIPWIMLPWTPLLLLNLRESWQRVWHRADERERFLWVWFAVQVVLISVSSNKHRNYVLPAMPALSLLLGPCLARLLARRTVFQTVHSPGRFEKPSYNKWLDFQRFNMISGTVLIVFLGCCAGIVGWVLPQRDPRLPAARFAQELRRDVLKDELVCVYGQGESPVVFYLGLPLCREETTDGVHARVKRDGVVYVVTTKSHLPWILPLGNPVLVKEMPAPPTATDRTPPLVLVKLVDSSRAADTVRGRF